MLDVAPEASVSCTILHRRAIRAVRANVFRLRVVAITIFALLFAQWSVAAYACPSLAPQEREMTDCAGMMMSQHDEAAPNLCAEHCHYGDQGDQPRTHAPAVSQASLYTIPALRAVTEPAWRGISSSGLIAARPPPHSILHCCFRI